EICDLYLTIILVFANGTLAIARAGLEDRGQYLCTAANPHGTAQLLVTLSVVAYPPRIAGGRWQLLTAHSGKPVAVACRAEGRPPPTIAWVLANKTHVSDSSTGNNDVRVEPDGTLIIKEATVYDRGLYTCVARNPAGTDTLVVKLQVVAAPPAILEEKRERVEGTMGENLKLPCTVTGNPRPAVHWVLFDGTVVKPLQFVNGKLFLFANGTLHLSTIAPSDSGNYECIATSSTGSDRRVVTLVVERRDTLPKIATASQEMTRLNFGDNLPDGTVINNAMYVLFNNGTLYLDKAGVTEGGDYTCYAQNTLGRDEMTIHVTVVMAAPLIKHNYKTHMQVKAGDTALLDCEAVGEPKPKIFWLLPSTDMISSSTARYLLHVNGSLSVSRVKLLDAGEYMCVARNPGGDDTKLYKLDVVAKPPIINGLYMNKTIMTVTAVRHSKKQIDCRAEGTPPPQIMWIMPDNIFLTAPYYGSRIVVHKNGTLEIRNIRPSDTAEFICVAPTSRSRTFTSSEVRNAAPRIVHEVGSWTELSHGVRLIKGSHRLNTPPAVSLQWQCKKERRDLGEMRSSIITWHWFFQ
uniref:Immunoglobulin superfamily member 10 n=1 Tax=Otus sunia TaxID=257818 RepID=A0A8C8E7X0_9STRI